MKILLVKPYNLSDHIQPSLGLGYLAQAVRRDHEVRILDCIKEGADIGRLGQYLKEYSPDVVGFQCYTFDLKFVKEALKTAKNINKDIITAVGGPHPSAMPSETMRYLGPDADYLFVGEAEASFPKLLDMIKGVKGDLASVPGLVWREEGRVRSNPASYIDDLDAVGLPAWDLIRPEDYPESQHGAFFRKFPIAPIIITRGCPYPCTFCAGKVVSGNKVRKRGIDSVIGEIKTLYRDHGIREFHVIDDNFTMDASYAKEFLRKLKGLGLDISWAVPNGVRMETLDPEILKLMKDTGLYLISLGIESGSDEILRLMKKGSTVSKIRECVRMINDSGIDVAGFFILGYPGETEESIRKTIRFSLELGLVRANFFTYLPFPGSESYDQLASAGELDRVDWDNFYFMNAAYVPSGLTRKKLKNLQRLAFASFYFRPGIMLYNIKSVKGVRHFKFLVKRLFRWVFMA
jgi:radical SAM superfamily enzyme YgiQ (UPF0313 family)